MTLPHRPHAVIFDMDGVLFDSEILYAQAIQIAAVELGVVIDPALAHRTIGSSWVATNALFRAELGEAFPVDALRVAWMRHYEILATTSLALKPGVVELLDTLDALAIPRAIATSSFPHHADHHLGLHGLAERFHAVVAYGDYANAKPAPDPFLKAAERLGVEPGLCLALEDSHNGIRSASAAGMITVMVPDLLAPNDEIRALCTHVAEDLHEVRGMIVQAA
jgi:HAD superfamily hydrolase (TIGR01509 family)